ncbi:OmpA family protein [Flavobacterium collinsii]|uniref:Peptidoglycan-associated lipoprotein n=1 Tax=Flavobacterium collinsii TaxID=1114861 RepID=A0ABM8KLC3_9FLAO|nr:OmpA family protein [Flavobacterium collinsii]CAA9200325.1 Peptidoglycan-associated lipoprotein [Flavobacterium collinsii]
MKIQISLLSLLMTTCVAFSQGGKIKKADEKYNNLAYIDAIEIYKKIAERGFKSIDLFQRLGNSYYFNGELSEANKWYTELFKLEAIAYSDHFVDPEYYYRYSQTLKSVGDPIKGNEYLELFSLKSQKEHRAKLYTENKNYLEKIKNNSGRYTINPLNINGPYSDYGGTFFNTDFVFTSSRPKNRQEERSNKWNNQGYGSLLVSKVNEEGNFEMPELLSKRLSSKFNESSPVFTKDGKTVYFTRNNYNKGKTGKNSDNGILLKLYKASHNGKDWSNITELPFNSNTYSVAHPALSPDEKTLYFSSNMPGTIGQSDLFKVAINEDGSYGKPENLGSNVNTEGRETFPFVSENNELFFASDGQLGLGGLDVFVAQINEHGTISKPENVGEPINTPFDDFSYSINLKTKRGFFSSNREGGEGFDDIYKFIENKPLSREIYKNWDGLIVDKETNQPIADVEVSLFDEKMNLVEKGISNGSGTYHFDKLQVGKVYFIRAEKENYETIEKSIFIADVLEKEPHTLFLEKKIRKIEPGLDLAKVLNIANIYFDFGKSSIRKDAEVELAKISELMKLRPDIRIEVRAHSDSRYTKSFNLKLSDLRARATVNWLVNMGGIDPRRVSGKGYGEEKILNKCVDGVLCTEEEHAVNRRSEFIVVGFAEN